MKLNVNTPDLAEADELTNILAILFLPIRTQSSALESVRVGAVSRCVHCVGVLPSGHASFRSKLCHNR